MYALLLITILNLTQTDYYRPEPTQDLVLHATTINSGATILFKGELYSVRLTVINNTDKVKSFCMWSCSWQKSFVIDIDSMDFIYHMCAANVPQDVKIPPLDSLELTTMLFARPRAFKHESFRIGLVIMTENELKKSLAIGNPTTVEERESLTRKYLLTQNLVWSNPLSLYYGSNSAIGYDQNRVLMWDKDLK